MTDPTRLAAAALLVAFAGWWGRAAFRRGRETPPGVARYRRWAMRQWLRFALPSLLALLLLGRIGAVATLPAAFATAIAPLPAFGRADLAALALGGAIGVGVGGAATWAAMWWRRRRGRPDKPPWTLGELGSVLPRHRGELGWAAVLAVSAGVSEELAFRLLLPLLLVIVTGNAVAAFTLATIGFGAMHRYQGWVGIVATTAVGALLSAVYLISGALWAAMLVHAAIDLNGLVLRPALSGVWRRAAEPLR